MSQDKIRQLILNLLNRRDYSQYEIIQKLSIKGYQRDDIQAALSPLIAAGLINEPRYAENYIYWRRTKGYGPLRILRELEIRGIPAEMIAEVLNITDNAWLIEIRRIWQKQFKGYLPTDFKSRAKQMRFLQYRGFTQVQIDSLFKYTYEHEE